MKLMLPVLVLLVPLLAEALSGATTTEDDSDLKNTEQKWVAAYYAGDGRTLSTLEADDFTAIANGQKQTKAQQIAEVESRGPVGVPQPNAEEEIRHYGDVALITGLSGAANVRFTTVWVKHDGSWKVVHVHYCQGE